MVSLIPLLFVDAYIDIALRLHASGIGRRFGIDPTVVRIGIVLLSVGGGSGIVAYVAAWLLLRRDDETTSIAQRARSLRDHAQSHKYLHDELGYNYRMDSFQAAVLGIKLKRLDAWNAARAECAAHYAELLTNSSYKLPINPPDSESVWHCYVIETPERDRVRSVLNDAGVETAVHYPVPVHLQKAYAHLRYKPGDLPITETLCQHCLSLPIYPELSKTKISTIASILLNLFGESGDERTD